jgi:transposase
MKTKAAMHVAKIVNRRGDRTYTSYLLRRSFREGDRVKHQTLGNLSHLPEPIIEMIRRGLKGDVLEVASDGFEIVRSLPHGHVAAVLGTLRQLALDTIIASTPSRERSLVVSMIVARVLDPRSKLSTANALRPETLRNSLGDVLGLSTVTEDELYAAMDWLLDRQRRIEDKLAAKHLREGSLVLYDVTSTYFEGRHCSLAKLGHSRDGKRDKLQIVFGLLCEASGCPIAVEVFEGNVGDPATLAPQIEKLRERFGLKKVVIVGDRGMITSARLENDLMGRPGLEWITALRSPAIRKLAEEGALNTSLFDERLLAEIESPAFQNERLIVCRNPLLAEERTRKREDLLRATERDLLKIQAATKRKRSALRGKAKIGVRVGKVLWRHKMAKHYHLTITDASFSFERREDRIKAEAALDGFYVLRTSVPKSELDEKGVVRVYKGLSRAERAFRSLKTVDLKVRPIYHYAADRVRAHVFLCMLAYYVEWHMRESLAPLLFDDETPEKHRHPVKPAQRSAAALTKAKTRRTNADEPVQSFHDLLGDLGTIVKNRVSKTGSPVTFDVVTTPTPHQRRAFTLLKVAVAV